MKRLGFPGLQANREILKEAKSARYYAVLFDSTSDVGTLHHDHPSHVPLYVNIEDRMAVITELFLDYIYCLLCFTRKIKGFLPDFFSNHLKKWKRNDPSIQDSRVQAWES